LCSVSGSGYCSVVKVVFKTLSRTFSNFRYLLTRGSSELNAAAIEDFDNLLVRTSIRDPVSPDGRLVVIGDGNRHGSDAEAVVASIAAAARESNVGALRPLHQGVVYRSHRHGLGCVPVGGRESQRRGAGRYVGVAVARDGYIRGGLTSERSRQSVSCPALGHRRRAARLRHRHTRRRRLCWAVSRDLDRL